MRHALATTIFGLALMLATAVPRTAVAGAMYNVAVLPAPAGPAGYEDFAKGINNQGQVIGSADGNIGGGPGAPIVDIQQPFIVSGGAVTNLGPGYGEANAINDAGQVAGRTYIDGMGGPVATLYSDGRIAPIPSDGAEEVPVAINDVGATGGTTRSGQAYLNVGGHQTILQTGPYTRGVVAGINDAGQAIVNLATTAEAPYTSHGFFFDGHDFKPLPGGASGLNASGQVVGMTMGSHAYFWDGTLTHDLGTLGGSFSNAVAINASGVIVGSSSTTADPSGFESHAFVDRNGVMTDLNTLIASGLGLTLTSAVGINDLGQIVALARKDDGTFESVVLTPDGVTPPTSPVLSEPTVVPEPTALAVFALAGLAAWARRSRRG